MARASRVLFSFLEWRFPGALSLSFRLAQSSLEEERITGRERPEKRLYGVSRGLMEGVENNGGERERESGGDFILAAAWPQHI